MKIYTPSLFLLSLLVACAAPAGEAGVTGDPGPAGDPGVAGASALVATSDEPAGANCVNGGVRIDYGVDANADGALTADEIDGTDYVCDGEDAAGALVETSIVFEADGDCAQGYELISIGVDDGIGGGVAHDGVLQDGELRAVLMNCLPDDLDEDGVFNLADNCPEDANAEQIDGDLDDVGDTCDTEPAAITIYGASRGSSSTESSLYQIDISTNAATLIGTTGHALIALKVNPTDGKLYGITRQDDVGECDNCLVELDLATGAATPVLTYDIGPTPSIAFLSDGALHGWTEEGDVFVSMGTDGILTSLGTTEDSWGHGMCADSADRIYWINGSGETWRIEPTDGTRTLLGEIEDSVPSGTWNNTEGGGNDFGVRGDCHPDSLLYLGVDVTYGDAASSLVTVRLSPDGAPTFLRSVAAPVADLHAIAIMR